MVFKSSKLIPVMIGGKFILKRKFAYVEYLSAIFLIWGLCIMTLGDLSVSPQFNFTGFNKQIKKLLTKFNERNHFDLWIIGF